MFKTPEERWVDEEWCCIKEHAQYGQVLIVKEGFSVKVFVKIGDNLRSRQFICYNKERVEERYKAYVTDKCELTKVVKWIVEYYGS